MICYPFCMWAFISTLVVVIVHLWAKADKKQSSVYVYLCWQLQKSHMWATFIVRPILSTDTHVRIRTQ